MQSHEWEPLLQHEEAEFYLKIWKPQEDDAEIEETDPDSAVSEDEEQRLEAEDNVSTSEDGSTD